MEDETQSLNEYCGNLASINQSIEKVVQSTVGDQTFYVPYVQEECTTWVLLPNIKITKVGM